MFSTIECLSYIGIYLTFFCLSLKVFVYQQIQEDEHLLYGFKTVEEKDLFLKLISVKGLGPKMALPMLSDDNMNNIYAAIEEGNINYLKKYY